MKPGRSLLKREPFAAGISAALVLAGSSSISDYGIGRAFGAGLSEEIASRCKAVVIGGMLDSARSVHEEPLGKASRHRSAADAARIDALAGRIPIRVDVFLNTWLIAVTQALDDVPPPHIDDPTVRGNFYLALGGNLLWAATSLFQVWEPIVVAMSFTGASIGSGVGSHPAVDQPPAPTKMLRDRMNAVRDELAKCFRSRAQALAAEIIRSGAVGTDREDQALWTAIFGKARFNNIQALKALAVTKITSAVAEYTEQWKSWMDQTEKEAARRLACIMSQMQGTRIPAGLPDTILAGQLANVRKETPFAPKLTY